MWQKLDVLLKTSARIPNATMTDLLTFMPDPIKEAAQDLLSLYDITQPLVAAFGPLPIFLFKACVTVGQCFTNHNGNILVAYRSNALNDSLIP